MSSGTLAFKQWAISESLVTSFPLEQIKNTRVGIDGDDYVGSLLLGAVCEPLVPVLGGQPFALLNHVDKDLRGFKEAGIDPLFVFSGLDLACTDKGVILKDSRQSANLLGEAWSIYEQGKGGEAVAAFQRVGCYKTHRIVRSVQFFIHSRGFRTQIAPYSAAAQLVYLENAQYIDAIYGWASSLLHGADRVITGFDWEAQTFSSIALPKILPKLRLNRDQFINLCLLSGSSILSPLPEIATETTARRVEVTRSLLAHSGNDADRLLSERKGDTYRELFQKARFALKHPVIMDENGKVEQVNSDKGPGDTHEFIGQRLPEEIYFYLSRNVIGPRVLNWRTRMEIVETPPLEGGSAQVYKDLIQDKLRPFRTHALALMSGFLNRYYQKQDVNLICWWNENNKIPLNIAEDIEPAKAAKQWHVKTELLAAVSGAPEFTAPLWYAISSLANESNSKNTITPRSKDSTAPLQLVVDIRANTIWRFLENRGYINADHTLSPWGTALKAAFDRAIEEKLMSTKASWTEIEDAILMSFELLRLDLLNSSVLFPAYSGMPMRGTAADKANVVLISRIACLGRFKHKTIGYTGPLSRDLLAYHQLTTTIRDALRDLLEMHACNLLLSGAVDRESLETAHFTDLGGSLPFVNEPDLGLALAVKSQLDELSNEPGKKANVAKWLAHALDIPGDLKKAYTMFDVINAGVQAGDPSIINAETKKMFKSADAWLAKKRNEKPDDEPEPKGI